MKAVLVLGVLAIGTSAMASGRVPDSELAIGAIRLGQDEKSVIRTLGLPKSRSYTEHNFLPHELNYPGVTVGLDDNGVGGMVATSSKFCTPSGACPGMSFSKIRKLYGAPVIAKRESGTFMEYYGDGCWLQFAVRRSVVKSLGIACQP